MAIAAGETIQANSVTVAASGATLSVLGTLKLGATLDGTVITRHFGYLTTTGTTTIKDHSGPATINTKSRGREPMIHSIVIAGLDPAIHANARC